MSFLIGRSDCESADISSHSSSGLLIYAALVDLLAEDFLSEEAMELMDKSMRIKAFLWVLVGGEPLQYFSHRIEILTAIQLLACPSSAPSPNTRPLDRSDGCSHRSQRRQRSEDPEQPPMLPSPLPSHPSSAKRCRSILSSPSNPFHVLTTRNHD